MKILSYVSHPRFYMGSNMATFGCGVTTEDRIYTTMPMWVVEFRIIQVNFKWPDNLTAGTTLLPCGLGWAPPSALAAQLSSGFPLVTDGGGKTVTKWLRSRQDNDYKREWQKSNGRKKFSARHFWSDCVKYKATTAQYIGEICRCFNA